MYLEYKKFKRHDIKYPSCFNIKALFFDCFEFLHKGGTSEQIQAAGQVPSDDDSHTKIHFKIFCALCVYYSVAPTGVPKLADWTVGPLN